MSIFDGLNKTPAQKRYETIMERAPKIFRGEKNRCIASYNDLWGSKDNPISIEEAQAVLDLFGSDAYQVFLSHGKWQEFILTVDPSYEYLIPPYAYTINEDGTVTLSENDSGSGV